MTRTPIEIVKAFNAAMAIKDYDTALKYVSADCEYTNIPMSSVRGPEGIRSVLMSNPSPLWDKIAFETMISRLDSNLEQFALAWGMAASGSP